MTKLNRYTLILVVLLIGCNSSSNEGKAQEERRDSTEYFNTSFPATKEKDSISEAGPVESTRGRTTPGTKEDSIKTTANPLYKGNNRDTL